MSKRLSIAGPPTIIVDLGSGMNHHKKGLRRLLDEIMAGD